MVDTVYGSRPLQADPAVTAAHWLIIISLHWTFSDFQHMKCQPLNHELVSRLNTVLSTGNANMRDVGKADLLFVQ